KCSYFRGSKCAGSSHEQGARALWRVSPIPRRPRRPRWAENQPAVWATGSKIGSQGRAHSSTIYDRSSEGLRQRRGRVSWELLHGAGRACCSTMKRLVSDVFQAINKRGYRGVYGIGQVQNHTPDAPGACDVDTVVRLADWRKVHGGRNGRDGAGGRGAYVRRGGLDSTRLRRYRAGSGVSLRRSRRRWRGSRGSCARRSGRGWDHRLKSSKNARSEVAKTVSQCVVAGLTPMSFDSKNRRTFSISTKPVGVCTLLRSNGCPLNCSTWALLSRRPI